MGKRAKVPITLRALIARINRKLHENDQVLKITRGEKALQELGDYYVLDFNRNFIVDKLVDPEELGRKLRALRPWEEVQS